jgi:hypothetical protein
LIIVRRAVSALGRGLALALRGGTQVVGVSARHWSVLLARAGAAYGVAVGLRIGDGGDDLGQRLLFFAPLGEPDVLVGHLAPGSGFERLPPGVDQAGEEIELLLVLGEVGAVGSELVALRLVWG